MRKLDGQFGREKASATALSQTRRKLLRSGVLAALLFPCTSWAAAMELELIEAPSNLGLRPPRPGHEPGTWRAPAALLDSGLRERLRSAKIHALARPRYHFEAEAGTRVRNSRGIRAFSLILADEVAAVLARRNFPLVLGGDCSILLGCLLGARRGGLCGLIHVDGHSDFVHPGNFPPGYGFGSAAGMDLALASGRGEALLTDWGPGLAPLVADERIVQIGEREDRDADYAYPDIRETRILRIDIHEALRQGIDATATQAIEHLQAQHVERTWLHIDVDVLDRKVMPAVDSPGSPGLNFDQLATLVRRLRASGQIIGADISVFDPELDPNGDYARELARTLANGFGSP